MCIRDSYKTVLLDKSIIKSVGLSALMTAVGTAFSLFLTVTFAYPLSRMEFKLRKFCNVMILIVFIFNAPLIPWYLTMRSYGLYDNFMTLILPSALSTYNIIIAVSYTHLSRSRAAAYRILYEVLEKDAFSHIVLRDTLNQNPDMTRQERAFAGRLVHGTLNHLLELDWMLSRFSKMKIDKLKPAVRTVLRMSVYQILYMDLSLIHIWFKPVAQRIHLLKRQNAEDMGGGGYRRRL